jgi:2-dehydro-3-deoxygluconokinase
MIETAVKAFPNFKVAATTLRAAKTATHNDWSAICWMDGKFYESEEISRSGNSRPRWWRRQFRQRPDLRFLNRRSAKGGGLWRGARRAGHDDPGDTSMASKAEVEKLMKGGSARVQR